jgi:hypothetical protein
MKASSDCVVGAFEPQIPQLQVVQVEIEGHHMPTVPLLQTIAAGCLKESKGIS